MLNIPPAKPSKSSPAAKLVAIIEQEIISNPFKKDGLNWSARPYNWYGNALGVSSRTIRAWLATPPFDRLVITKEGKRIALVRLKKPGDPMSITHCQRVLQKIWVNEIVHFNERKAKLDASWADKCEINIGVIGEEIKKCQKFDPTNKHRLAKLDAELDEYKSLKKSYLKKSAKASADAQKRPKPNRKEYGCFRGLVKAWGTKMAPELLTMVIRHWSDFMLAVKVNISELQVKGENVFFRYYDWPSLPVILLFNPIAIDMKIMQLQEETSKQIDMSLSPSEQLKQQAQLWKSAIAMLKPESFAEDAL